MPFSHYFSPSGQIFWRSFSSISFISHPGYSLLNRLDQSSVCVLTRGRSGPVEYHSSELAADLAGPDKPIRQYKASFGSRH